MESVTVVTVTYGDRWKFLDLVLHSLLNEQTAVNFIVIVDNGAKDDIETRVKKYSSDRIIIVHLPKNTGSATGYKVGIETAIEETNSDLIWLLDDDNKPDLDALEHLLNGYELLGRNPNNALLSLRNNDSKLVDFAFRGNLIGSRLNSFFGFHILDLPQRITRYIRNPNQPANPCLPLAQVRFSSYGGLLFHRSWVKLIGLPNSDFFIYGDDYEYTYRITKSGGCIYLCATSRIQDIDKSWHNQPRKGHPLLSTSASKERIYYSVRNYSFFEVNQLAPNRFVYYINMLFYTVVITVESMIYTNDHLEMVRRLFLFLKALNDGWHSRLGIKYNEISETC